MARRREQNCPFHPPLGPAALPATQGRGKQTRGLPHAPPNTQHSAHGTYQSTGPDRAAWTSPSYRAPDPQHKQGFPAQGPQHPWVLSHPPGFLTQQSAPSPGEGGRAGAPSARGREKPRCDTPSHHHTQTKNNPRPPTHQKHKNKISHKSKVRREEEKKNFFQKPTTAPKRLLNILQKSLLKCLHF